jgi:hypothetical protein
LRGHCQSKRKGYFGTLHCTLPKCL